MSGSVPSPVSRLLSNVGDCYEITRDAFAELGVDQESVDTAFVTFDVWKLLAVIVVVGFHGMGSTANVPRPFMYSWHLVT